MMMQHLGLAVVVALAACSRSNDKAAGTEGSMGAAGGAVTRSPEPTAHSRAPNRLGRIPILEYHMVRDSARGEFIISRDKFKSDLQLLYDRGYRPITVAQLIDKDFSDVPPGMSPVVFTFDDASPEQFSYIERNGQLEIDSTTVVGMWLDFSKKHPDWKNRATFCLLPAAGAGHAFFGDNAKWRGQKNEWRHQKVKWLADNGFELCSHTLWHAQLSKFPDVFVQEQIARGQLAIDSVMPGYRVRTFALPQGLWPKNRELAWRGSWTDARSGKVTSYDHDTVLEVAGGPVRSPYDPQFDPKKLTRLIVFGNQLERALDRLDASNSRFVWDGLVASSQ